MSLAEQYGRVCHALLRETFGETVSQIAMHLYCFGSRPLGLIAASLNLPVNQVKLGLSTLIQHNLVNFQARGKTANVAEYTLVKERVISFLRYSKYLLLIKYLYGDEAEIIIEELLCQGQDTASNLILKSARRLQDALGDACKNVSLLLLQEKLGILATNFFITRCGALQEAVDESKGKIPVFADNKNEMFTVPAIDNKSLNAKLAAGVLDASDQADNGVLWRVNFERFNEELRNQIIYNAAGRRIDDSAAELMKLLLRLWRDHGYDGSTSISAALSLTEIRDAAQKTIQKQGVKQHLEQYLKALAEDSSGFIVRAGDAGGGQFVLNLAKIFESLTHATLDSVVLERLGSKSLRLFRLTRSKGYVEQDQLQQLSMVPSKEAKLFTYRLLEQNFVQLHELRKTSNSAAPTKTFFLFHVNTYQVASKVLEMAYKGLYNALVRRNHELTDNHRLLMKEQRVDSILATLRDECKSEEQVQDMEETLSPPEKLLLTRIHAMVDRLSLAEVQLEETVFILENYLKYSLMK